MERWQSDSFQTAGGLGIGAVDGYRLVSVCFFTGLSSYNKQNYQMRMRWIGQSIKGGVVQMQF